MALSLDESENGRRPHRRPLFAAPWLAAMCLSLIPLGPSCAQNLVQDPSFEDTGGGYAPVPGYPWQVISGFVDVWPNGWSSITAQTGTAFANPFSTGGSFSQDVSLARSGNYQFKFYYAANTGETWALTAKVAGITVFNGSGITNTTMQAATSVVTLAAGTATVEFDASTTGCCEFGIDEVSLLFLGPNAFSFADLNGNQIAIATALNTALTAGVLTAVTDALAGTADRHQLAIALDQLSPEIYNYGLIETLYGSQQFANDLMSCKVAGQEGASIVREGQCLWVKARARYSDFDRTSRDIGAHDVTGSFSAGGQGAIAPDLRFGLAAGYDNVSATSGTGTSEGGRANIGGIIKYNPGPLLLGAGVSGGWGSYDTDRTLAFGGFGATAHGNENIDYVSGQLHAAYLLQRDSYYLKPLVDAAITNVSAGGFSESGGGGAGLSVAQTSHTVVSVSPAIEVGTSINVQDFVTVRPFLRTGLTWQDTDQFVISANFLDAPDASPFTTATRLDTLFADVSAGVDVINTGGGVFRLQYDGHYADQTQISSISIKGSAPF